MTFSIQNPAKRSSRSAYRSAATPEEFNDALRVRHIGEHALTIKGRLMGRELPETRSFVEGWLEVAADPDTRDTVRIGALVSGVRQVVAALGFAIRSHREDKELPQAFQYGARSAAFLENVETLMPVPSKTLDALLSIGEGEGQAPAPVRQEAVATYIVARAQFAHMGYVETPEQSGRAAKIAAEFPHARFNIPDFSA